MLRYTVFESICPRHVGTFRAPTLRGVVVCGALGHAVQKSRFLTWFANIAMPLWAHTCGMIWWPDLSLTSENVGFE